MPFGHPTVCFDRAPHNLALSASPNQEPWQRHVSTILSPLEVVLVGPIN
jgi:hypothetical protein